ncbi:hypothetical protein ENHAE0001_2220 [Enhydrobacter aerosaccus SK60]|nr:hypothetical protein ENHAE0001_2220 [Enhydrobacter aerosaccus SK60]
MVAKLLDGTPVNVGVYKAYRNAGLSHNQAMAITAEVGRENSFNPSTLFGTHTDPAKDKNGGAIRNVGMLSWNQGRDAQVLNYMRNAGVLGQQSQANLNAQAAFSVREMLTGYKGKLRNFLNNPNGSPEQFAQELGKNYIVWAYGQNTIRGKGGGRVPFNWQKHDARRRNYLSSLAGMLGDKSYTPQSGGQAAPQGIGRFNVADLMKQSAQKPQPLGKFNVADLMKQTPQTPQPLGQFKVSDLQAQQPQGIGKFNVADLVKGGG